MLCYMVIGHGSVTISLFLIYLFSWMFSDISYKQNKKINQEIDVNIVFKAFSFILSMIAILIFIAVNKLTPIPLEVAYILTYGILSLFTMYYIIMHDEIKDEKSKKRLQLFWKKFIKIIFGTSENRVKSIIIGFALVVGIFMLTAMVIIIYIYKGISLWHLFRKIHN